MNDKQTPVSETKRKQTTEALIGKYLIGSLSSLLIFIGAVSLIGLVWESISDIVKLLIISGSGIILTALGFWLIRKKKNPITSIILGTGSGLLFISIISANMAFNLIDINLTIMLSAIWGVFFILSSWYNKVFFTTIIGYIGSYCALILGLYYLSNDTELISLFLFATSISGAMIFCAYKNNKNFLQLEISFFLSFISFASILIRCNFDGLFYTPPILHFFIIQTIVMIIIFAITILLNMLNDKDKSSQWSILFNFTSAVFMFMFLLNIKNNYFVGSSIIPYAIIFFVTHVILMIVTNIFVKVKISAFNIYYSIVLIISFAYINFEAFNKVTGLVVVCIILFFIGKYFKRSEQNLVIAIIVLIDSFLLIVSSQNYTTNISTVIGNNIMSIIYGLAQIGMIGYVLYDSYRDKNFNHLLFMKLAGLIVIIFNSYSLTSSITRMASVNNNGAYLNNSWGYLMAVIIFSLFTAFDYFKDWTEKDFILFRINQTVKYDEDSKGLFFVFSIALYLLGILQMVLANDWSEQFIFSIACLGIIVIHSFGVLKFRDKNNESIFGIWLGSVYLVFVCTFVAKFMASDGSSILYSVAGLIVSVVCISLGFIFRFKTIRVYGLVLTIVMVAKVILIDVYKENTVVRVIALIAGGIICFVISIIYYKLDSLVEDEEKEVEEKTKQDI